MKKRYSLLIFLILFVALSGCIVVSLNFFLDSAPASIAGDGVIFRISKGEALGSIASRLEEENLIRSSMYMRILSKTKGTEYSFKSGTYKILPGYKSSKIHDLLVSGKQDLLKVTIPEGWTIKKIADLLDDFNIASKEEFITAAYSARMVNELYIPGESVEGYLFPDTYFFPENYTAEAVIKTMVAAFFKNLGEIQYDHGDWKRKDLYETVILASIVEREYQIEREAPLIASVFKNRLKDNIGLESCATLAYIITEVQEKPHPRYITQADTKIDSLYNTYKWHGLPPGPISNPGRIALNAAFHPADTNYYYFLRKDPSTGEHYFAGDLEEHNNAKRYYIKGEPGL